MTEITITPYLAIDESEIEERFIRGSGPGGQNVNKVATAVQIRFDVLRNSSLPEAIRDRLLHLAANRVSAEGFLIVEARRFRTQERNRQDARERLATLIRRAAETPKPRRPTKPIAAAQSRRVEEKRHRGKLKQLRQGATDVDE